MGFKIKNHVWRMWNEQEMYDEYDSASTCIKTFHKIGNTAKNYNDAKAACEARGESLPIIRTEEDNQNVRNACGASTYCCWIDLNNKRISHGNG